MLRIGQGYDVHAFGPGDHVVLGGVRIAHSHSLVAHSDGDVLLHALCDALLGALALGDIGQHFPDTDATYHNADSTLLLARCYALVQQRGYTLVNADITLMCEHPKIAPHSQQMRANISATLNCSIDQISVKATTSEKLGFTGRSEGILASATVLLQSVDIGLV